MVPKFPFLFILIAIASSVGCSGNGATSITIDSPDYSSGQMQDDSQRTLWGIWDFGFDIANLQVVITPAHLIAAHYNITPMVTPPQCPDCIQLHINSFDTVTHILDVDVTLKNPTSLSGYDVRGILFTNDAGHELRNPDDWTGLWDIPGGNTINPFKAFAKTNPLRIFAGFQQHTENYRIYIPTPPQYAAIKYAVDASWPGNCREPYSIENFTQETIAAAAGSHGVVSVDVHDWQGDATEVRIYAPVITGEPFTALEHQGGDEWSVDLNNNAGAATGDYEVLIEAKSSIPVALYDYATITIGVPGEFGWARTWGGDNADDSWGVDTDGAGNVYVGGVFRSTVDFDPGPGTVEYTSKGDLDIFAIKFDKDGNFVWAGTIGGTGSDFCRSISVTQAGDVYIAGYFEGSVDFDPGTEAGEVDMHTSNGNADVLLIRLNSSGDYQWGRSWGASGTDTARGVAADDSGRVYAAGAFRLTVDFDPGAGPGEVDTHQSNGSLDVFLSCFSSNGDFQGARTWGGTGEDRANGLAVDSSGNAYVTGQFVGTADFDPGPAADAHTSSNNSDDPFLCKFSPDGDYQWGGSWGGDDGDYGRAVAVDQLGNVYIAGNFRGAADFNPDPIGKDEHTSNGDMDIFFMSLNSSGAFQWARTWGCKDYDDALGAGADNSGGAFVTGWVGNNTDFDPDPMEEDIHTVSGFGDAYICKFDSTGDYIWGRNWGGDTTDTGGDVEADANGYSYVTGWFNGTADFDPGTGIDEHTSFNGYHDSFVIKFNPTGYW